MSGWKQCFTIFVAMFLCGTWLPGQANIKADRVRLLSFRVSANRLSPSSVTVPKGRYTVRISNGVYSGPTSVELLRSTNERTAAKSQPQGKGRDQFEVDLTPGQYMLRVSPNLSWVAQITVQ